LVQVERVLVEDPYVKEPLFETVGSDEVNAGRQTVHDLVAAPSLVAKPGGQPNIDSRISHFL
jgi:hypothetical protein